MAISHLYIDARATQDSETAKITQRIGITPEFINNANALFQTIRKSKDPWAAGKEHLLLTRNRGAFIKKCPGTRDYICCGYQILHIGTYCTMDCAYCILQSYFHPPLLQYFVNHNDLMIELDQHLRDGQLYRIGTGEFTDSLIWESYTDLSSRLIHRFAGQTHAVLELKTKTTAVDHLKKINHQRKTILAWSLNTPRIIATQERGTASLKARLQTAARCQSWNYPLAFHFDPIVIYPGCEEDYRQVIKMLFEYVSPHNIVWISMGTLRFMPALKPIIQQRFPESDIVYGELIPGLDGKMRYFKPLRINIYRCMAEQIKKDAPQVLTYLCMEDETVWYKSFGFAPDDQSGLATMLDQSAREHCGLSL